MGGERTRPLTEKVAGHDTLADRLPHPSERACPLVHLLRAYGALWVGMRSAGPSPATWCCCSP